jgi:DNA-binding response OmpR family regulator
MGTATVSDITEHKKKILVVEDEPDITSLFRKVLMREGFRVMSTMTLQIR